VGAHEPPCPATGKWNKLILAELRQIISEMLCLGRQVSPLCDFYVVTKNNPGRQKDPPQV
jgi:hypothetical protein